VHVAHRSTQQSRMRTFMINSTLTGAQGAGVQVSPSRLKSQRARPTISYLCQQFWP
jgi:hypothetical protein